MTRIEESFMLSRVCPNERFAFWLKKKCLSLSISISKIKFVALLHEYFFNNHMPEEQTISRCKQKRHLHFSDLWWEVTYISVHSQF